MPVLRVIVLWHQHQPFYKDLVTGEYRLPWVRLHALKDYYGMVKLLDEFPNVHQTFNLVPSLMTQIQDYVAGTAHDPFLQVAAKPAKDLTPEERLFALQYLFQANEVHRDRALSAVSGVVGRFRNCDDSPERCEKYFSTQDFTDLQVLSQIAWFDEFFLEDKDIAGLINKGSGYSFEDQQFVINRERELIGKVLPAHAEAAQTGKNRNLDVAVLPSHSSVALRHQHGCGFYAWPALPQNRFQHPEDAREQLLRGLDLHEKVFGVRPREFGRRRAAFPKKHFSIGHSLGVKWMATDEGVLGRTLGVSFARDGEGRLPGDAAEKLYNVHRYENGQTEMHLVFRDHTISDLVGFVYSECARSGSREPSHP